MYGAAFNGIKGALLARSPVGNPPLLHTLELIPRMRNGKLYVKC